MLELMDTGVQEREDKDHSFEQCCGVTGNLVKYKESLTERYLAYVFSWRTLSLTPPVPTKVNSGWVLTCGCCAGWDVRDGVWKQREGVHPNHSRDMEQLPRVSHCPMNKPQVENKLRELGGSCLHTGVPGWAVRGGSPVTVAAWAGQKAECGAARQRRKKEGCL